MLLSKGLGRKEARQRFPTSSHYPPFPELREATIPRHKWNKRWPRGISDKEDSTGLVSCRMRLPAPASLSQGKILKAVSLQGRPTVVKTVGCVSLILSQGQASGAAAVPSEWEPRTIPQLQKHLPETPSLPLHSFSLCFQLKCKYLWVLEEASRLIRLIYIFRSFLKAAVFCGRC